ncbi:hypothetical protein LCGC14_2966580, partial [marine sediment metagenome]
MEIIGAIKVLFKTKTGPQLKREFNSFTKDWDTKINYRSTFARLPDRASVHVGPFGLTSKIYEYVSEGTRPHAIAAKNAPLLRFRTDYRPHTTASGGRGGPGVATGPVIRAKAVMHPGIKARDFDSQVAKSEEAKVVRD